MHSKKAINETKHKKTKIIKQRLKMLVSLQPIYLLDVLGMTSKGLVQPSPTSKSLSFPLENQAVGSFLTLSQLILL